MSTATDDTSALSRSDLVLGPKRGLAARVKKEALAAGLICHPMSGTIDGQYGDHVLQAPPFIIKVAQIDELFSKLLAAIERAIAAGKNCPAS